MRLIPIVALTIRYLGFDRYTSLYPIVTMSDGEKRVLDRISALNEAGRMVRFGAEYPSSTTSRADRFLAARTVRFHILRR